jgi:hypothetical protein
MIIPVLLSVVLFRPISNQDPFSLDFAPLALGSRFSPVLVVRRFSLGSPELVPAVCRTPGF